MALLEVTGIGKRFGSTHVLEDISLSLEQGEALAIIGSSGSGKTTLLRCLNFLETPDTGRNALSQSRPCGTPPTPPPTKRAKSAKSGFISAWCSRTSTCSPVHRAAEHHAGGRAAGQERPDYKQNRRQIHDQLEQKARGLLAQMGLSDRADHYPHQLSGGQQQRVAIARALALEPDILCFDEPTSALDPELTGEVLRVLRDLAAHKTTMIIVTHEMAFARDVADRILFMDGGVVVEEGPARQVIDHPREERTRRFLANYNT